MEENNVFHLAKVLQNTDNARNELQTFLQAMQTRVEQDYLQKIQAAAALQQADAAAGTGGFYRRSGKTTAG